MESYLNLGMKMAFLFGVVGDVPIGDRVMNVNTIKQISLVLCLILPVFLSTANGFAQSEELRTERIEYLERTLDLIQRRMREVEEEITELKGTTEEKSRTEQIEERVMMLEKEMENQKRPNTFHAYWKDGRGLKPTMISSSSALSV